MDGRSCSFDFRLDGKGYNSPLYSTEYSFSVIQNTDPNTPVPDNVFNRNVAKQMPCHVYTSPGGLIV